jgi:hypothetical protein
MSERVSGKQEKEGARVNICFKRVFPLTHFPPAEVKMGAKQVSSQEDGAEPEPGWRIVQRRKSSK